MIVKESFKNYDIRGIIDKELNTTSYQLIASAISNLILEKVVVVGRDARKTSSKFRLAFIQEMIKNGVSVYDLGEVPTPLVYFASKELNIPNAFIITASHNPKEYNGLKMIINNKPVTKSIIDKIFALTKEPQKLNSSKGTYHELPNITYKYLNKISESINLPKKLKVVVDCGNAVAGNIAPKLLTKLGVDVIPLYCEIDGDFPNHHPDPVVPENMKCLINKVKQENADLGIGFDGDGDRLGVVDANGRLIFADEYMKYFIEDILTKHKDRKIIFDIKCSNSISQLVNELGGQPILSKTGHSIIKDKIKETNAIMAGEMSGHIFFNDRWYGHDDALYAACRLLELIANSGKDPKNYFSKFPVKFNTPELKIPVEESEKETVLEDIKQKLVESFTHEKAYDLDGIRLEANDYWLLIRASNTTANLIARIEADTKEKLDELKAKFSEIIKSLGIDFEVK